MIAPRSHGAKVRLYVEHPLAPGQALPLTEAQAHYLIAVMRLGADDRVLAFNGQDGEWLARLAPAGRRAGALIPEARTAPQMNPPDLWLLFAPLKKGRTDFIVEKAAELGAARILPVQTRLTNAERIRQDRLQAHAVEAAEQCGGTFVPPVEGLQPLDRLLDAWPRDRRLMWCDEGLAGRSSALPGVLAAEAAGTGGQGAPWAILIGPEGGFHPDETRRLRALPQAVAVALGPRILRADTAAVAALALWQAAVGDWG
ncbi:MAG TPA: 16S rRNA (uracil(1498)-N(3))-methyltransferase [Paracoccaceae bacterium]|nr:16S rRNA (uracil(1498)-N(3))-methyltransferase [Paracoccaceae bacterium]HMO71734.1 16S rRNA (uracil(1498)-N(3))-methyltransferase [Paracoccaceae bacterium]